MTRSDPRLSFALACGATLALGGCGGDTAADATNRPDVYEVTRGPLRVTVTESAELKPARETRVRSDIEGQATVLKLVQEGSIVKEGELLVELDVSDLVDRRANQAISVERARAALVNAQEDQNILEKEIAAEEAEARSAVEVARIDLEKFLGRPRGIAGDEATPLLTAQSGSAAPGAANGNGGASGDGSADDPETNRDMLALLERQVKGTKYAELTGAVIGLLSEENLDRDMGEMAQQILRQIDALVLAEARLKLAEDTLGHSKRLYEKDYVTRNEFERDQLDHDSQKSNVTLAWNDLDLLVSYTQRKDKIDLELKVDNAGLALERVQANARAKRARAEAEVSSKQSEFDLAKELLDRQTRQIGLAELRAPHAGMVVFATLGDGRRGREVVEEGLQVRQRQTLIVLPDTTTMVAHLKIQEADVTKVFDGQPALIRVDAFGELSLTGRVSYIARLADSGSRWSNNDLKVYKAEVTVEGENTWGLRPGMSAEVEIIVDVLEDVLSVPLAAIRQQGRVHYVWRESAGGTLEAVRVKIGRNNVSHVEIAEGIAEGDRVLLAAPTDVDAPEFEQPAVEEPAPVAAPPERPRTADRDDASAEERGRGSRRGGGGGSELIDMIIEKLPHLADKKSDMRALFRNQEVRDLMRNDPDIAAKMAEFRGGMRGRGGGEGGGSRRGGGGNGERGGR